MAQSDVILPPVQEKGRDEKNRTIGIDRRLYLQLTAFCGSVKEESLVKALGDSGIEAILYRDLYDPFGYGLLSMSEDAGYFVGPLREFLQGSVFADLKLKPRLGMFGRSYTLGHEKNPEEVVLRRPRERASNPDWPWAVWYPLRRRGEFETVSEQEQQSVLGEHGRLGMAFGREGYGVDIRLACYGMDTEDNDFLIGLVGPSLHRLSLIVQAMRKTEHTSRYIERLGPFFVGRAVYRRVDL